MLRRKRQIILESPPNEYEIEQTAQFRGVFAGDSKEAIKHHIQDYIYILCSNRETSLCSPRLMDYLIEYERSRLADLDT